MCFPIGDSGSRTADDGDIFLRFDFSFSSERGTILLFRSLFRRPSDGDDKLDVKERISKVVLEDMFCVCHRLGKPRRAFLSYILRAARLYGYPKGKIACLNASSGIFVSPCVEAVQWHRSKALPSVSRRSRKGLLSEARSLEPL
jgi:hypothetical protein